MSKDQKIVGMQSQLAGLGLWMLLKDG